MIRLQFRQPLAHFELDIDAELPESGITAIFGRSGAGKTSVINAVSGLNTPSSGLICIGEQVLFDSKQSINVPIEKRNIGYVFQEARLFPHYTVKGNLLYGVKGKPDLEHFKEVVELLALEELLTRLPADLSGGEKQRCSIARALLSKPALLLMDEPLASLDLPRKQEVMPFLERLAKEVNIPILYVTHSMDEILHLADHMMVLDEGKVAALGPIEQVWQSDALTPWLIAADKSSLFSATVAQQHERYALTYIELKQDVGLWMAKVDAPIGEPIRIRIHASDVSIALSQAHDSSIRNILAAQIMSIDKEQGEQVSILVALGARDNEQVLLWVSITAWAYDDLQLQVSQSVFVQIKGVSLTNRDMARR